MEESGIANWNLLRSKRLVGNVVDMLWTCRNGIDVQNQVHQDCMNQQLKQYQRQ